ncbi:type II secretion system protein [bacterium]|nr:type II secretion system protein [bacterium]
MAFAKNRGFSLVEIILVLGVIAILSGGVLYNFSSMSQKELLDSVIIRTKKALIFAQESLRQGRCQDVFITFDFENQEFATECKTGPGVSLRTCLAFINYQENDIVIEGKDKNGGRDLEKIEIEILNQGLGGLNLEKINAIPTLKKENGDFLVEICFKRQKEKKCMVVDKKKIIYGFELKEV